MNHGALKNENDIQSQRRTRASDVHRRHKRSGRVQSKRVSSDGHDGDTTMSDKHRLEDAEPIVQPVDAGDIANTVSETMDTTRTISESADKIVVTTNTKRGTETRDEDKIRVKVKGDDPTEVVDKLNETLRGLHNTTANELRAMQPDEGVETDGGE